MQIGKEIGVATGKDVLILHQVQMAGKNAMTAGEFARGQRDFVGTQLRLIPKSGYSSRHLLLIESDTPSNLPPLPLRDRASGRMNFRNPALLASPGYHVGKNTAYCACRNCIATRPLLLHPE